MQSRSFWPKKAYEGCTKAYPPTCCVPCHLQQWPSSHTSCWCESWIRSKHNDHDPFLLIPLLYIYDTLFFSHTFPPLCYTIDKDSFNKKKNHQLSMISCYGQGNDEGVWWYDVVCIIEMLMPLQIWVIRGGGERFYTQHWPSISYWDVTLLYANVHGRQWFSLCIDIMDWF